MLAYTKSTPESCTRVGCDASRTGEPQRAHLSIRRSKERKMEMAARATSCPSRSCCTAKHYDSMSLTLLWVKRNERRLVSFHELRRFSPKATSRSRRRFPGPQSAHRKNTKECMDRSFRETQHRLQAKSQVGKNGFRGKDKVTTGEFFTRRPPPPPRLPPPISQPRQQHACA